MALEKTLAFVKPDGMQHQVSIIQSIRNLGLEIVNQNIARVSEDFAKEFYRHVEKVSPSIYFDLWHNYITSDMVRIMELQGENAVKRLRALVGTTDPETAAPSTIRKKYGADKKRIADIEQRATRNIIHCSGNPEEAESEIKMFYDAGYLK